MSAASVSSRVLVALMNSVPASAATRFEPTARSARIARRVLNPLLPSATTTVVVRAGNAKGLRVCIDPRNEKFYWTGRYEPGVQDAFVRLLHPGATVWDVGAHIGFFTALAARCVGPTGTVHAIEPLAANRARLARTIRANRLMNVHVHAAALAREPGRSKLRVHASTSMASLGSETGVGVEVTCFSLDDMLVRGSYGTPLLVKIDAEGAEIDILRGGLSLARGTDAAFIVEFHHPHAVDEARELLATHTFESLSNRHWLLQRNR